MITFLSKLFHADALPEDRRRGFYGKLCGAVGIFLNLVLFAGKLFAGILSSSIAITADAFNNLSDAGSSVVSLVSFRLSEQKPDAEHPYGHGRLEYVARHGAKGIPEMSRVSCMQSAGGGTAVFQKARRTADPGSACDPE